MIDLTVAEVAMPEIGGVLFEDRAEPIEILDRHLPHIRDSARPLRALDAKCVGGTNDLVPLHFRVRNAAEPPRDLCPGDVVALLVRGRVENPSVGLEGLGTWSSTAPESPSASRIQAPDTAPSTTFRSSPSTGSMLTPPRE